MTENQWLRRAAKIAGYLVWFIILVQVMFLSTDNPYTSPAEIFGSHVGHAFWLLVLALIPYFMARARAKKNGGNVSWPYVMTGVTLIAFVLSIGGFYGRLATKNNSSSVSASSKPSATQPTQAAIQQTQPSDTDNWWWEKGYLAEPEAGSSTWLLVGEWRCTQEPSTQSTRLILAQDGSISATNEGSSTLLQDPWLRWYVPNQKRGGQMYFVNIKIVSANNIALKYPSGNIDECVR